VSWRLAHELLFVIVAVATWGCFIREVMGVVVNVGVVMGTGILADMLDVTAPS
jgi:hypothetical protein